MNCRLQEATCQYYVYVVCDGELNQSPVEFCNHFQFLEKFNNSNHCQYRASIGISNTDRGYCSHGLPLTLVTFIPNVCNIPSNLNFLSRRIRIPRVGRYRYIAQEDTSSERGLFGWRANDYTVTQNNTTTRQRVDRHRERLLDYPLMRTDSETRKIRIQRCNRCRGQLENDFARCRPQRCCLRHLF